MPTPRSAHDIRETFLAYFESKGHTRVASASLVPNDPTLLFTNAGMVPFKRVFTGEETRPYKRATTTQKVMRVSGKHNDLEEVGRSARHQTFFEMLGNFSFGDYFKHEAIEFAWELITQRWRVDPKDLVVSVFREDDEAAAIWEKEIGLPASKIYRLGESENFWQMGDTGPCGPCTEIHIDRGPVPGFDNDDPSSDSGRFLEFWNLVFMQFNRDASGKMAPLPKPSVDTGAGLERVTQVLSGFRSNYETDLFVPILARAQDLSGVRLGANSESDFSLRVIADHARAVAFLIGDGVLPANEGRGYVLRRILRRASRHGVLLGLDRPFLHAVADTVIDEMARAFPELAERRTFITDRVRREEERFLATLKSGLELLEGEIANVKAKGGATLPGSVVFRLYDTFGFPVDLTQDVLKSHAITVDEAGFAGEMETQRARSREAWKGSGDAGVAQVHSRIAKDLATEFTGYEATTGESRVRALLVNGAPVDVANEGARVEVVVDETPFYAESGGQVGDRGAIESDGARVEVADTQRPSGALVVHVGRVARGALRVGDAVRLAVDAEARAATVRNHSGTHLLHAALRHVLGPQAMQKGSLVSPDRLRFDFTHDAPLSDEQIERIEDLANAWIEANDAGRTRQMGYKAAIAAGAMALFDEKYGDEVRVVSFGAVSTELCGGTHARATGDIGLLKVLGESGIASGVRRIEALTGLGALAHLRAQEKKLKRESDERIQKLRDDLKAAEKQIAELKRASVITGTMQGSIGGVGSATGIHMHPPRVEKIGGVEVHAQTVPNFEASELRGLVDDKRGKVKSGVVLFASTNDGKVALALGVTPDLKDKLKAGDLVREISAVVGGKGGGRPDFAQGGGTDATKIDAAIDRLFALVREARA